MDPLAFHKVGPGLTFVSSEVLLLKLGVLSIENESQLDAIMKLCGLGVVKGPDDQAWYHWESFVLAMIRAMNEHSEIRVKRGTVTTSGVVASQKPESGMELMALAVMLDKAFDREMNPSEMAGRLAETMLLYKELISDARATGNFGLGESGRRDPERTGSADVDQ